MGDYCHPLEGLQEKYTTLVKFGAVVKDNEMEQRNNALNSTAGAGGWWEGEEEEEKEEGKEGVELEHHRWIDFHPNIELSDANAEEQVAQDTSEANVERLVADEVNAERLAAGDTKVERLVAVDAKVERTSSSWCESWKTSSS